MGWNPNDSIVKVENAPTDKPPAPGPRPKRRGKIEMKPAGNIQGMVRLRKKNGQHSGVVSGMADQVQFEEGFEAYSGVERHIISAYESGLIDDADLDALL